MKYCPKCGATNADSASSCQECGSPLPDIHYSGQNNGSYSDPNGSQQQQQYRQQYHYQNQQAYGYSGQPVSGQNFGIQPRNIVLCIIFSIITCGIYGIYWMIKMNDEVNALAGEPGATTGGMVFLFTLITCGIYGWYWLYKMGERCDRIKNMNGSSNVLYLILGIVGLSIVSYCLIQDTINKRVSQA